MSPVNSPVGAPGRAWRAVLVGILVGALVGVGTLGPLVQRDNAHAREQPREPGNRAASFALEVDGFEDPIHFSELVAIVWELGAPSEVVLERGLTNDSRLSRWFESGRAEPETIQRNGVVIVYDPSAREIHRFNLTNAWPKKLEIGALKAGDTSLLVEKLTLAADLIDRVDI